MTSTMPDARLNALGLSTAQVEECQDRDLPGVLGRVSRVDRGFATIETAQGALRIETQASQELVVGDWLGGTADQAVLLTRHSELARLGGPHKDQRQTVVANVDLVVIVHSAVAQFRLELLSTFLVMAYDAGAEALVVISKSDLIDDADAVANHISTKLGGVETMTMSTATGYGLNALRQRIKDQSIVLLGESGTGKSTLTNELSGSEQLTAGELSRSGQGKHTTTHRELIVLPTGGVVIDTPGVRDAASFSGEHGIAMAFHDICDVVPHCRFSDCEHGDTAGCAVSEALASGALDLERVTAYLAEIAQRTAITLRAEERQRSSASSARGRRSKA